MPRRLAAKPQQRSSKRSNAAIGAKSMAITELILDAASVGTVIGFPDGYLSTLQQITPQSPSWQQENILHGRWTSGRFVLRDDNGVIYNFSTQSGEVFGVGGGVAPGILLLGASIAYRGDLYLECLPRGAVWMLQISDVPVANSVTQLPGGAYPRGVSFGGWKPGHNPAFN